MAKSERRSILCPNCRKLISIDEPRCPHCGTIRPGSWWKNNLWTRGFRDSDQLLWMIIYVNVGMYVLALLLNPRAMGLTFNPLSLLSPSNKSLLLLGGTGTFPIDHLHRWWTLISANYLHGGILHILFNMVAFRQLGRLVLQEYGSYRMLAIYTIGGIVGFGVSYLAGVTFTIGASASVCSLIGATLYFGRSRGGAYGQAVYRQIGGWAIAIFVFGLLVPGINNWAHGGGIVAGAGLGYLLGYRERREENFLHKVLAGGCALLTGLVLIWGVVSGIFYRVMG
jgi:rhomboid protease GluP